MSTLLNGALSIQRVPAFGPTSRSHQSNCGRSPAIRSRRWRNWSERHRQREALRELADDKHLLDDIGLTREQALYEAAKPFWW